MRRGRSRAVELPESVVAVGRARIQYGVPLAYVMRTFRLSQDLLWAWLFARITDLGLDAADQAVALELVTSWLFSHVDGALVRSEQIYEREREAWLQRGRRIAPARSMTCWPGESATISGRCDEAALRRQPRAHRRLHLVGVTRRGH